MRIEPDRTAVLLISGHFAGALIMERETDEVILEPRDRSEQQIARAFKALTGG